MVGDGHPSARGTRGQLSKFEHCLPPFITWVSYKRSISTYKKVTNVLASGLLIASTYKEPRDAFRVRAAVSARSLWRPTSSSRLGLFSLRARWVGIAVDAEVESRPASKLLGRYLRHYIMWVLGPWERALVRWRVTPNALTFASFVVACFSAVFFALGNFGAGGWLYLLTGILDILDGRIARATGKVTKGGAFFDSVMDRYAELVVFGGLAVFYRAQLGASTWRSSALARLDHGQLHARPRRGARRAGQHRHHAAARAALLPRRHQRPVAHRRDAVRPRRLAAVRAGGGGAGPARRFGQRDGGAAHLAHAGAPRRARRRRRARARTCRRRPSFRWRPSANRSSSAPPSSARPP